MIFLFPPALLHTFLLGRREKKNFFSSNHLSLSRHRHDMSSYFYSLETVLILQDRDIVRGATLV